MKLFQIEYMMATCKSGSISKAADELLVSRPAVSRALRDLEQEFGVEFFQRTTTGIALTEAGMVFYEKCTRLQQLLSELDAEMRAIKEEKAQKNSRRLTIAISFTARYFLLPLFSQFEKAYPDITLRLSDISGEYSSFSYDPMAFDAPDLSISLCFSAPAPHTEHFDLMESEFVFCCSRSHPLAKCKTVSVPEIKDEPLVVLEALNRKTNRIDVIFGKYGLKPNIQYVTNQIVMMKRMIKEGGACSIKPRESICDDPEIVLIPFDEPYKCPMRIQWDPNIRHNTAFYDFLDFAKEYSKNYLSGT